VEWPAPRLLSLSSGLNSNLSTAAPEDEITWKRKDVFADEEPGRERNPGDLPPSSAGLGSCSTAKSQPP
jgi:hypothetical protein